MQYHESTGYCRGSPEVFYDRDCRDRCDALPTCTGYVLPVDGSNLCGTYKSAGASGDGRAGYKCYMKGGTYIINGHFST